MEEHCSDEWLENQDRDPFAFVRKVMLPMKHVAARERLQTGSGYVTLVFAAFERSTRRSFSSWQTLTAALLFSKC